MDRYEPIATYYDCEHADLWDDVEFYRNLIRVGPVLEVGCGTGRVMAPLAESGLTVWGIDSSAAMLRRAQRRLAPFPNVHLLHTSILDLSRDERFRAIIWPLNTLWHLTSLPEQLAALQVTRAHLQPGSLAVIDLSNPLTLADRGGRGELRVRFDRRCEGRRVLCTSAAWDNDADQLLSLTLIYDELGDEAPRRTVAELSLRYTYRAELELLLWLAGLTVERVYGSYDLDEYSSDSPSLIVVARAAH